MIMKSISKPPGIEDTAQHCLDAPGAALELLQLYGTLVMGMRLDEDFIYGYHQILGQSGGI